MSKAHTAFEKNIDSIASLIRGADIYCQLVLALSRSKEIDLTVIQSIISEKKVSALTISWRFFMTKQEYEEFDQAGHLRRMCEHIVFASYVAVESYLISKFQEYFHHVFSGEPPDWRISKLNGLSFRSLDEIKRQYSELLRLKIAIFEPDPGVLEEASWFRPASSWEGLLTLQKVRNELAHHGEVRSYNIFVLVDAWSAFDFVRRWVSLFDANFDAFIFEGRATKLMQRSVGVSLGIQKES